MTGIQFIERNGKREYAVVPMPLFARMAAALEDLDDEALFDKAKAADDGFHVPGGSRQRHFGWHPPRQSLARAWWA